MADRNFLLFNYFTPTLYLEGFKKINLDALKNNGIKLILCDVDNTLMRLDERTPSKDVVDFVKKIKYMGFDFALFSNNVRTRVERCAKKIGVDNYFWDCRKPFQWKMKIIKKIFKYKESEIIMIGDQLITDVFVANLAHIKSILVTSLAKTNKSRRTIKFFIEKFLFKKLKQNNLLHEGFYDEEGYEDGFEIL